MKNKKNEYQPDDKICIFYVADRIKMLEGIKSHKQLRVAIRDFKDEVLKAIAIDVMIKRQSETE